MPFLETPGEIADWIADQLLIYECHNPKCPTPRGDHCHECECRTCFVDGMTDRIRRSVCNEIQLRLGVEPMKQHN